MIKQGAQLITSAEDVCLTLGITSTDTTDPQPKLPIISDPIQSRILKLIADGMSDGDQILQQLKLSPDEFNFHLTMLEINGYITPLGANRWMLKL